MYCLRPFVLEFCIFEEGTVYQSKSHHSHNPKHHHLLHVNSLSLISKHALQSHLGCCPHMVPRDLRSREPRAPKSSVSLSTIPIPLEPFSPESIFSCGSQDLIRKEPADVPRQTAQAEQDLEAYGGCFLSHLSPSWIISRFARHDQPLYHVSSI